MVNRQAHEFGHSIHEAVRRQNEDDGVLFEQPIERGESRAVQVFDPAQFKDDGPRARHVQHRPPELVDVGHVDLAGNCHLGGSGRRGAVVGVLQLKNRAGHRITPSTKPASATTAWWKLRVIRVPCAVRTVFTWSASPLIMVSPRPPRRLRWLADESPDHRPVSLTVAVTGGPRTKASTEPCLSGSPPLPCSIALVTASPVANRMSAARRGSTAIPVSQWRSRCRACGMVIGVAGSTVAKLRAVAWLGRKANRTTSSV